MFGCVVPNWYNCLERIRGYGLVEGSVPLEVGFERFQDLNLSLCLLLPDQNASSLLSCLFHCPGLQPSETVSPIRHFLF